MPSLHIWHTQWMECLLLFWSQHQRANHKSLVKLLFLFFKTTHNNILFNHFFFHSLHCCCFCLFSPLTEILNQIPIPLPLLLYFLSFPSLIAVFNKHNTRNFLLLCLSLWPLISLQWRFWSSHHKPQVIIYPQIYLFRKRKWKRPFFFGGFLSFWVVLIWVYEKISLKVLKWVKIESWMHIFKWVTYTRFKEGTERAFFSFLPPFSHLHVFMLLNTEAVVLSCCLAMCVFFTHFR